MTTDVMINYGIYGLVIALAVIGAAIGYARGAFRQLTRIVTVGVALVIAFPITLYLKDYMISFLGGRSVADVLNIVGAGAGAGEWYTAIGGDIVTAVIALPAGLVLVPLMFVALFIFISWAMLLFHKMICGIVGFTRANNNLITRSLGAFAGAIQGAAMALVILLPVSGLMGSISSTVSYVEEKYPDKANSQQISTLYNDLLKASEDNFLLGLMSPVADAVYPSFTVYEIDGEEVDVRECVKDTAEIYVSIGDLAETDWGTLNEKDKATIKTILDVVTSNRYFATIGSGIIRSVAFTWQTNGLLRFDETMDTFVGHLMEVMKTSSSDNLEADMDTLRRVTYLLSDSGALRALMDGDNALDYFIEKDSEGKLLYTKFTEIFKENARMSGIVVAINHLAFDMLLRNNESHLITEEAIENVKMGINDTLAIDKESFETEEEYRTAVNESVKATLDENHIPLSDEQMDMITDYVINDMQGVEEITDEQLTDFMNRYYEIYNEKLANGEITEEDIPEFN